MLQLVAEIASHRLDRAAVRDRRKQLAGIDQPATEVPPAPFKPFTLRFKSPDRVFSLSLSFRTEKEPERADVIRALEEIIDELKQDEHS